MNLSVALNALLAYESELIAEMLAAGCTTLIELKPIHEALRRMIEKRRKP